MNQRLILKQNQNPVNENFHVRKSEIPRDSYSNFQEEIKHTSNTMSDSVWHMGFLEGVSYPPIKLE